MHAKTKRKRRDVSDEPDLMNLRLPPHGLLCAQGEPFDRRRGVGRRYHRFGVKRRGLRIGFAESGPRSRYAAGGDPRFHAGGDRSA